MKKLHGILFLMPIVFCFCVFTNAFANDLREPSPQLTNNFEMSNTEDFKGLVLLAQNSADDDLDAELMDEYDDDSMQADTHWRAEKGASGLYCHK